MTAVVTTTSTVPARTATATSSSHSSSLSTGTISGIVIGSLLGGVLFTALVLYLLKRYTRHRFTRVANPRNYAGGADLQYRLSPSPRRSKLFTRHSQKPSISSEPLVTPAAWPPLPATSRVLSLDIPPRLDPISPADSLHSSFDLGEIYQVTAPGTASRVTTLAQEPLSASWRPSLSSTPPHIRQTSGDDAASPPTPPGSQQTLFLHRMLKSRAQASEGIPLTRRPSLDLLQTRSTTLDSSDIPADEERLLAEAECTGLRDMEPAQMGEEDMGEGKADWQEVESTGSIYSQVSASIDHSGFSESTARQNTSSSFPRQKSSRKQRAPVPSTELPELPSVAEMPDSPKVFGRQTISRTVSTSANSSLDAQLSHGTVSRQMSSHQSGGTFPLLTSVKFGKGTSAGTPTGSISSTAALGSSSSGRASRYPSLAPSSIGLSSLSGPRSDAGVDWHHPPPGLAGLTSLQIGPLQNPHSPVKERREHPDALLPAKRARLREGTSSSIPEVEVRDVTQGGIARIDVAL